MKKYSLLCSNSENHVCVNAEWTLISEFGYFLAKQLTRYDYGRNMRYGLTTSDIILRKYTKGKSYVNSSTYYNTQKNGGGNYNRMQILLSVHIRPPLVLAHYLQLPLSYLALF